MNRRSACFCFLAAVKTVLVSTLVVAAEATGKAVAKTVGHHWNVNGDWNPSAETVRQHLRTAHGIDPGTMELEAMLTLHDRVHDRMGGHGHVHEKPTTRVVTKGYSKF